ncbi:MAG: hypothetical protein H8E76_02185 [Helicobacteraceae bacterium]|nr:hypothetical protein [Candidatus Sulfurimonas ponti]MBL6973027.1 hypothetical protein [Sulfurimonas sp.]
MDSEILYSLFGIIGFILVIYFTLKSTSAKMDTKTEAKKKEEIIQEYKLRLEKALESLNDDKDLRTAKKTQLLQEFNSEFSRNIFFDEEEIRDIIAELSLS